MSAETLRRAAALMRQRAVAATGETWERRGLSVETVHECAINHGCYAVADAGTWGVATREAEIANAEHIASWHPAVAWAVAHWLATVADDRNADFDLINSEGYCALAVARTFLGREVTA